jgi:AraC-like DNA-binding protein
VLLPTNSAHDVVSRRDGRTRPFASLMALQEPDGEVRLDGPGERARILCAAYDYDHEVTQSVLALLPPVLHRRAGEHGDDDVGAILSLLARELGAGKPGSRAVGGRLVDVLFVYLLRGWLQESAASDGASWLPALVDPDVARALAALHHRPGAPWTLQSLAAEVNLSRATLARRFTRLVGEPPLSYLARWRMDLAAQRLRDTSDPIAVIADEAGYGSERAFARAFARRRGTTPGRYRQACRARAETS